MKERMLAGKLYKVDKELRENSNKAKALTRKYNSTTETELDLRKGILNDLFGSVGEHIHIEPPFRCDYGKNIYIGKNFYANFDCIILDVCDVKIGNNVKFGSRVNIYAATHPVDPGVRITGLEYGKPVVIEDDVWIGGNVVINPGVTIGEGSVVGSGSVVTKSIPKYTIAVGNPCKVLRSITIEDKEYWKKEQEKFIKEGNEI